METDTKSPGEIEHCSITEGSAVISGVKGQKVFYNPVQEFNRDLSIAVLSVFTQNYFEEKKALAEKRALRKKDADGTESEETIKPEVSIYFHDILSYSAKIYIN